MEEHILPVSNHGGRGEPGMRRIDAKPGMRVMTPDGPGTIIVPPDRWVDEGYIPVKLHKLTGSRACNYYVPRTVKELKDE